MYGERRPEFDPDALLRDLRARWDQIRLRIPGGGNVPVILGGLLVIFFFWMATGFFVVAPAEQAAVRLFGEFRGTEDQGLHWYPPSPIGTVDVEPILEVRTMELGFRSAPARDFPVEAQMITGDLNIVDIQLVVQYRIRNLEKFLFSVDDPGEVDRGITEGRPEGRTLKDATEAALRQVVGQRGIDDVLTVAKEAVQEDTKLLLQEILDYYEAGLEIRSVNLQIVRPPDVVRDAFDDVVRARVDKESRINEANAEKEDRLPRAQGAAEVAVQDALAFKEARIARARGEAAQFLAVLAEYSKSPNVTRQRLYLEAMEEILPSITKFVVDPSVGGNLLQFLPLTPDALPSSGAAPVEPGG